MARALDLRGEERGPQARVPAPLESWASERRLLTGLASVLYSASSVVFVGKAEGFFGKRAMNAAYSLFACGFTYRFSFAGERVGETRAEMTQ